VCVCVCVCVCVVCVVCSYDRMATNLPLICVFLRQGSCMGYTVDG